MPATHKKLTIGGEQTAAQATAYLADPQATGDYYSEAAHAFMRWVAGARVRMTLGLNAEVELWKVERLMNGQHPTTGQSIRWWGPNGTMIGAHDVTVSPAPKSVSIVWALADDELRREIELMVGQASDEAFRRMLLHVPLIKERYGPGPNDLRLVKADDYVAVEALHTTARLTEAKPNVPDPDLHLHCVLFGALDAKGRLKAIDSLQIRKYRAELGAHASARLAEMFRLRGWQIERTLERDAHGKIKSAHWELAGVPAELIQAMSTRRREIDKLKQQYREHTGREPEGVGFEKFLLQHRGPKSKRSAAELRREWIAEGHKHGYGPEEVALAQAEAAVRQAAGVPAASHTGSAADQLRAEILADLTREHALVPTRELHKLAMQRAQGLIDPITARGVLAEMFGDGDLLITADRTKVTTLETLALEQRAIRAAGHLLEAPPRTAAERKRLEAEYREAQEDGSPFDQAQREAIALAVSGARFVSITGPAGTGKGFASRAAVNIWHDQGRRVLALAVAGRTAQQARVDSGTDLGFTLNGLQAKTEHDLLSIKSSDVLYLDEGGMVDHERYVDLLELAVNSGATLVQVGDDKQLSPVEAGGLWTVTHRMAGNVGLATELETIRRARNPTEAQAWTNLRNGEVEKALLWYRDEGRLHLYDSRAELLHGIVEHWWASDPEGVMVVDTTNQERDSVNRIAQAKRLEAGQLGADSYLLTNEREIRVGDRVLTNEIHRLNRTLNAPGPRIENGTPATVRALDQAANAAVLELHEPAGSRMVVVDPSVPLELAYARHVYKAQGMNAEVGNIGLGPETSQERAYVMASRSKAGTYVHAVRAEIEDMGADPTRLEQGQEATIRTPAPHEAEAQLAASDQLEAHANSEPLTTSELMEVIEQQRAEQLAQVEEATIREIAAGAQPEAKQAIHQELPEWAQSAEPRADEKQVEARDLDRTEPWWTEFHSDYDLNPRHQQEPPGHDATMAPASLSLFNGVDLQPGQVVTFAENLPLRAPAGISQGELGVVRSVHRGGFSHDFARVELVGGREVQIYQPDQVALAPPEVTAQSVLGREPALDQRDPASLSNLSLINGAVITRGDTVRFAQSPTPSIEAGTEGRVTEVERHSGNRATVQLDSGRSVAVTPGVQLEVIAIDHQSPGAEAAQQAGAGAMPARVTAETMARDYAQRGDTTEALAMYRSLDRLIMAQDPERAAVEHASQQPGSLLIAQDQAQRQRLLNLIREREAQPPEAAPEHPAAPQSQPSQPEPEPLDTERPQEPVRQAQSSSEARQQAEPDQASASPERTQEAVQETPAHTPPAQAQRPTVITAQDAYSQRAARREQWVQESLEGRQQHEGRSDHFQHHVEPGAIERATVVISDPQDAQAISRGVSGAAEARLVIGTPDPTTAETIHQRADQISAHREAQQQQAQAQQAEAAQQHQAQQQAEVAQAEPQQAQAEAAR